ncbi:hypothetical protein LBMAG15_20680 [Actinomycetes bacterium]|nr:hypothetical protein LBMAG15_20680 [Actinomycetes bacterium]
MRRNINIAAASVTLAALVAVSGAVIGAQQAARYPAPSNVWTDVRFSYVIAIPKAGSSSWLFDQHDQWGQSFAECDLAQRTMSCQ